LLEFKQIVSQFVYRIEPKPSGGFVATCKDPGAPAIEGATRDEVQQKIQENIQSKLAQQFPSLATVLQNNSVKLHYHVDPKPGGGFVIHHGDPAKDSVEGSTREHLENFIESKLLSSFIENLPPDLHQQITYKLNSEGLDIEVNRNVKFTTGSVRMGGNTPSTETPLALSSGSEILATSTGIPDIQSSSGMMNGSPITYEKSNSGRFFRVLWKLAIIALLIYLYLHRR
jgi:hypothetical protein